MTKGYAFAYQAIGKYMWDAASKTITDDVLAKVDEALAEKVYNKIWSELVPIDKEYIKFIAQKDSMPVADLLEITGRKHNEWSIPRKGRQNETPLVGDATTPIINKNSPIIGEKRQKT